MTDSDWKPFKFQHTAARRRLVSTNKKMRWIYTGFNTQPPEGGWAGIMVETLLKNWFQHTAARRRLEHHTPFRLYSLSFNTQPPEGGWPCRLKTIPLPS